MTTAIEVKGSTRVHDGDLRGLRALGEEQRVKHKVVVCMERSPRRVGDTEVLPWQVFLKRLYAGELT